MADHEGHDGALSRRRLLGMAGMAAAGGVAASAGMSGVAAAGPGNAPPFETQVFPRYYPDPDHVDEVDLSGKVVVITGASRGIGKATAELLESCGATVIGTSRTPGDYSTTYPLLPLELTDPVSIGTFLATVQSMPQVVNNGGIDVLINNAGRFSLGSVIPLHGDIATFGAGLEESLATLYGGHISVTSGLLSSLIARGSVTGYARLLFTCSIVAYAVGGAVPGVSYYQSYISGKRALLAYANSVRGFLGLAGLPVQVATVNPYSIATDLAVGTRPIFTQPVDGNGDAIGDPFFQAFLDEARAGIANGLPASFAAEGFKQLLTAASPEANVVIATEEEPLASQAQTAFINEAGLLEMQESAIPYGCEPPGRRR